MADLGDFIGPNAAYVLDLYERFRRDPDAVDEGWRSFFRTFTPAAEASTAALPTPETRGGDAATAAAAERLAMAIRAWGHTAARLDPLGDERAPDPRLDPAAHGLPPDALPELRAAYEGTTGYEFSHLPDAEQRRWLEEAVEEGSFSAVAGDGDRRALLERLSEVEGFEKYLHRAFFGQKRFSIEGTDVLVPMLDTLISAAGRAGAARVVIGMAHRGRLNVLTHVLGKSYEKMIAGFVTASADPERVELNPAGPSGDVKYHLGWEDEHAVADRKISVVLAPNPSHLEFVDPVVLGMVRASQDRTEEPGLPEVDAARALAVLVHGDAAFTGQGVVAETLNLAGLPGYSVGGTIHLIANNQIGFTTGTSQGRATRYASDPARGYDVPVIHVNADEAEACLAAVRLAHAFRERFHGDVVVDLVGYRRWGHNEGDEPAFTQPRMYEEIRSHPTVRERLADELVGAGVLTREDADALLQQTLDRMEEAQKALGDAPPSPPGAASPNSRPAPAAPAPVSAARLEELNAELLSWPDGFEPNSRLARLLERRRDLADTAIDWGHAEALAFASLQADGIPIRITGQDAERGTFSHRHAVLHDAETGETYSPLASLPQASASCEIRNSPLSETAALGFEYGYSVFDPTVLVVWEAQFGDFANGAQVILDQFLAAARQKWEQRSGVVLLLPHGYEGQGPEHSSARLERFLQLAGEGNLRVVNCTTSAQYFHLLRRQAASLADDRRPLVVMSPKSLLRHPLAASSLDALANGSFEPVLADSDAVEERAEGVTRLLLCSGKVWVDLVGGSDAQREEREEIAGRERVALARVEELYPFPADALADTIDGYPALREIVWVQEEPRNMGGWTFVEPRLRALAGELPVRYVGRPERASPATGSPVRHAAEQAALVEEAWSDAPAPPAAPASRPRERERSTQPA